MLHQRGTVVQYFFCFFVVDCQDYTSSLVTLSAISLASLLSSFNTRSFFRALDFAILYFFLLSLGEHQASLETRVHLRQILST